MRFTSLIILVMSFLFSNAKTWEVGPNKTYTLPSQVAPLVNHSDTILIDAGTYESDVTTWTKNNLTIKGTNGRAHLKSNGLAAGGKAIWVIQGDNTFIENIEFSGCSVPDKNGAGIRQEGANLTLKNCYFHDNENGLLAGNHPESEIVLISCEFARNGYGDGYTHNIYINHVKRFVMKFCYSHLAHIGHNVKSRAFTNEILYNRIMDEENGDASMQIDLPNGGFSVIMGNIIMQGTNAVNRSIITYGTEGLSNSSKNLWVVNNTFVNKRSSCTYIKTESGSDVLIANNIFAGTGTLVDGIATELTNFYYEKIADAYFADEQTYNYQLTALSTAINGGTDLGYISAYQLVPEFEYKNPLNFQTRNITEKIDAGAYEFHGTSINEAEFSTCYYQIIDHQLLINSSTPQKVLTEFYLPDGRQLYRLTDETPVIVDLSSLNQKILLLKITDEHGFIKTGIILLR